MSQSDVLFHIQPYSRLGHLFPLNSPNSDKQGSKAKKEKKKKKEMSMVVKIFIKFFSSLLWLLSRSISFQVTARCLRSEDTDLSQSSGFPTWITAKPIRSWAKGQPSGAWQISINLWLGHVTMISVTVTKILFAVSISFLHSSNSKSKNARERKTAFFCLYRFTFSCAQGIYYDSLRRKTQEHQCLNTHYHLIKW